MEQQTANLYTKKVFAKFQEELVETFVYTANKIDSDGTISKFRVAKYEHDHKAYIVTLDVSEMNASCSCLMFEYSGVICRHILTVFTVTNVLTIPSHYILKRWTRNARASFLDEKETDLGRMESLKERFNKICWEAQKIAEEGAIAEETFKAAMDALREGARQIATVKKCVMKIRPSSSQGSGSFQDNTEAPVADLHNLTMSALAINRNGTLADNMVIQTCLKSMTWVFENKNTSNVAVINLKLQDYRKGSSGETEVHFRLTRITLEPMLKSMAYISQQFLKSANRVAVINLKLQDAKTTNEEMEVTFQVSKDTLSSMLRSMAYIREQL